MLHCHVGCSFLFSHRPNAKKTKVLTYNIPLDHPPLKIVGGNSLVEVSGGKYLTVFHNCLNTLIGTSDPMCTTWNSCTNCQTNYASFLSMSMYIGVGRPLSLCPCVGSQSTSLLAGSFIFMDATLSHSLGSPPYRCLLVTCSFWSMFSITCSILV